MSNGETFTVRCPKCKRILLDLTGLTDARGIIKCFKCNVEVLVDMSRNIHTDNAETADDS